MAEQINQTSSVNQSTEDISGDKPKWLIWVLIVVGIIAIGFVIYLFVFGKDTASVKGVQEAGVGLEEGVAGDEAPTSDLGETAPEQIDVAPVDEEFVDPTGLL
ncbi:MAG: hypothetical protein ABIJ14_03700 [Nanoarchaeota archaeon]|nr:hypothetical protein [Nanoarchaeota archaeon]